MTKTKPKPKKRVEPGQTPSLMVCRQKTRRTRNALAVQRNTQKKGRDKKEERLTGNGIESMSYQFREAH
jgi:hypothetical protein